MSDESYASDLGRTTAFSDGVFAIAITLLVLSLDVPEGLEGKQVSDFVGDEWPQFFAYFLSFAVIGRYWISHHAHFAMLRSVDARLVVINLAFLSFVCLIPFPTGLLGEFGDSSVAVALYASVVGLASLLALAMIRYTPRARDDPHGRGAGRRAHAARDARTAARLPRLDPVRVRDPVPDAVHLAAAGRRGAAAALGQRSRIERSGQRWPGSPMPEPFE